MYFIYLTFLNYTSFLVSHAKIYNMLKYIIILINTQNFHEISRYNYALKHTIKVSSTSYQIKNYEF